MTVLFADLVDSTGLGDGRDPEELRAAVRPHLAQMRSALEHHGGTFEKFVGDAVMAVFGAPSSHEDDPERAVRAGLAIRDSVRGVRVGVNTGEAVVQLGASSGAGEGIATGDVVTTTFRIEEAADIDAVLVGESTYRATRDAIEYGERRMLQAKGKSEPVAVYEALRTRFEQRPAYEGPPLAPLVGRKEELSLILDTLSRARRDRTVQLLTLVGVPGIGKSRLVWELQRAVADEPALVTWRRGRCLPYGDGVTFWALGEMIKAQAGVLESDDVATTEEKLRHTARELVADPGDAAWVEGHLRPLLGLDPAGSRGPREEAFAAWRRALEGLAERGLLVLVFEDLHWADDGLLDFIDHVADWSADRPIVLLCTARPELRDRRRTWGARANAATVLLSPLTRDETGALLGFLLRQRLVPAELQAALTARSAGNPLYAEEFVRMLVERGLLYRNGGGWQLRDSELPVPESVQAIIAGRLDGLPPDEKAVLRDAAVVGRSFWPPAVAAVSGLELSVVDDALHVLEQKEFVRRVRQTAVESQRQYSFHHALVRDVAYGQIPHVDRAAKHCAVAEWIEALGRPEDHAETIAHHYLLALEYARAAGQDTSHFAAAARTALADAAARVLALSAPEQAERYYTAALDLSPDGAERGRLLSGLGKARMPSGAGVGELEEASSLLLEHDDRRGAAEADVLAARLLLMQGRHEEASDRFDRALALVDGTPESPEKAVVLANVAGFRMASDRGGEAIKLARQALELAERFGLSDLQVSARATIGTARVSMGDAGGVEDLEASIAVADDAGSSEIVRAYLNLGSVLANLGDVRRAAELHGLGREAAERFGDPTRLRWFVAERLYELYWNDAWDEALELAAELLAETERGAPHVGAFDAHLVRGWIRLARGEVDGAADDAERALELGRSFGGPQLLYPALAFAARVRLASGDELEAGELASELLGAWGETRVRTLPSFWVSDLAVVLRALGRGAELEAAAATVPPTRWLDAAVAHALGDDGRARELYAKIGSLPG